MSLQTPEKIRSLQKKLYVKAKSEPSFRFYSLLDKICRNDVLEFAWRRAKSNGGARGVDGRSFAQIERGGLEKWLNALQEDLRSGRYKPNAVRRVYIPKPGGGERALGIPTVRDRVAQTAVALVLLAIFEADISADMYGYRPGRRYLCASPSRAAVKRLRAKIRTILHRSNVNPWDEITAALNRILRGWAEYFSFGHVARPYWWVDAFVLRRARGFLTRRHKLRGMGTRRFPPEKVFGPGGLVCLGKMRSAVNSHA